MKKNKNKIIKLAKKKAVKIAKFFKSVIKKYGGKKNKNHIMKIAKLATVFVFILLVASGFIFQNKIKKSTADYFITKGNYYFNNGAYNTEKAERYFSWALRLNPSADAAYYQLARIHLVENELDLARQEIDKSLAINSENQRAFYIRGLIDGYDKKYDDAISDFQKFVAWAPAEWAGYNDLAWVYFLNKDFENTKKTAQAGLDNTDKENPWLLNGLGVAYVNLGEPQKAEEVFAKAKEFSTDMTPEKWASAYPGNDPSSADINLRKFRTDIDSNTRLAMDGFMSGGTYTSACNSSTGSSGSGGSSSGGGGSSSGGGGSSSGGSGSTSCKANCSCAANTCTGSSCGDGCGRSCSGTMGSDCSGNGNVCAGVMYSSPNGCGTCTGTLGPDCSGSGDVCVGTTYASPNGCGDCAGTKWPAYTAVCSYIDTGNTCDQDNCNKTIQLKTAYCTNIPNNGCGSPYLVGGSNCSNVCKDQFATCPACSWKEVAP